MCVGHKVTVKVDSRSELIVREIEIHITHTHTERERERERQKERESEREQTCTARAFHALDHFT